MKAQSHTLSNGLEVLYIDTKAFPTLTTLLLVGAGSRYENEKNNGIAHFFEHMAFKGSKKYPNSFVISSAIEGLGGVFNAFTSKDHTGYWIKSTNEHFETVLDVISDMVLNPLLVPEEIEREKGVIVEELNLYEDTPYRKAGEIFETLLYKDHPLGYDIGGTKQSVKAFTRDTFTDYISTLYHPKNSVLVVAGGLKEVKNIDKIIESKLGAWADGKKAEFETIKEVQLEPQSLVKYKKTEQAHFCLGFRTFSFFDKRKYALTVLSAILGGGMSSRLFMQVRERRGLCYYISTGREFYHDAGNMVTQAGITLDTDKIKEAITVILKEHKKISKGDITPEELTKAKELIKGRMILSVEDSFNVAAFFGTKKLLENSLEGPEDVVSEIENVTADQIAAIATEFFVPEGLNFSIIGPFEKEDEFKEVLTI